MAKKRVSFLKLLGIGLGTFWGGTNGPYGNVMQSSGADQAIGSFSGNLFTSITGYDPKSGWAVQNLEGFWIPVVSFSALDWIAKKLLHRNVKLTKDISLF